MAYKRKTMEIAEMHVAKFKAMPDEIFIRLALSSARYLDNQSRAIAREALRRFNVMHPEVK